MENETKKSKLTAKDILAKTGPGIIMAAAAVGTGTVTTSAILGARYEYGMIWMVILALFMRGIYMRSAYTAQVVLGMPILDCINKFYGKALCAIAGFVCAFGCVAYEVGNFSGSGISINLLFGLDWKIGGVIMSLVCLLFIFGRSIYNRVEKGMKICVFLMVAGFLIALIAAGGPSPSGVAKGLVPSLPDKNALFTTLAFIGSCAAISGVVYGTHLSKEKKWDTEDIKNGTLMWDVILGAGSIALIVLLVLLTSAKILYPQGITVSEVNDLTMLFKTIVGAAAPYLLGICLLAASASSLLVSAQMGATLLLAGFGREAKMEDKDVQWLSVIILALGALTAFIFGSSSPTQVLLIANICAVINAPLLAILIIMIVNRKEMGEFKSSKINNILLSLCCAGLLAVTVYANGVCASYCCLKIESDYAGYSLTIPSKCNALMNKQLFPTESIDSFIDDLQRIYAERVCVGNLTICREIPSYPAYQLSPEQSDVQRLTSLLRKQFGHAPELRINQSVSDGNILYNELRIPTVLFGPHGVAFHTECEYVKISSLSQYMDELYAFIKQEYTR